MAGIRCGSAAKVLQADREREVAARGAQRLLGLYQPDARLRGTRLIMQKVITINLNGNAYQLDEQGYDALRAYLDHARVQLGGNPDAAEILRDVEQSIAEKCLRVLGPGKTVVTTLEIEQILREIGPVESSGAAHAHGSTAGSDTRRLYQSQIGRASCRERVESSVG